MADQNPRKIEVCATERLINPGGKEPLKLKNKPARNSTFSILQQNTGKPPDVQQHNSGDILYFSDSFQQPHFPSDRFICSCCKKFMAE